MGDKDNRRRQIWVDGRFQARTLVLVVSATVALFMVSGALYVGVLNEQQRLMGILSLSGAGVPADGQEAEFANDMVDEAADYDQQRLVVLALIAAVLVLILAYASVRVTFRAAGPAFAVARMLDALRGRDYDVIRPLRDGDQFLFLGRAVTDLRDELRRRDAELDSFTAELTVMLEDLGKRALAGEPDELDEIVFRVTQLRSSLRKA